MSEISGPKYTVEFLGEHPRAVKTMVQGVEWLGLVRLAKITPGFEALRDGFFRYAQTPTTAISPLKKEADDALVIQITADNQDKAAETALDETLRRVSDLVNMDTDPNAAISIIYDID